MTCSVADCPKAAVSRQMCGTHYSRWRRNGDAGSVELLLHRGVISCTIEGCQRPGRYIRGLCPKHYTSLKRYGDPAAAQNFRPANSTCEAPDCTLKAKTNGLCPMHIWRFEQHQSFDLPPRSMSHQSSHGYLIVRRPGHPLANPDGWVYEHRQVLYDAIGPDDQDCHWCGKRIVWGSKFVWEWLEADHVDWNRQNNAIDNLVASCHACNSGRLQRSEITA